MAMGESSRSCPGSGESTASIEVLRNEPLKKNKLCLLGKPEIKAEFDWEGWLEEDSDRPMVATAAAGADRGVRGRYCWRGQRRREGRGGRERREETVVAPVQLKWTAPNDYPFTMQFLPQATSTPILSQPLPLRSSPASPQLDWSWREGQVAGTSITAHSVTTTPKTNTRKTQKCNIPVSAVKKKRSSGKETKSSRNKTPKRLLPVKSKKSQTKRNAKENKCPTMERQRKPNMEGSIMANPDTTKLHLSQTSGTHQSRTSRHPQVHATRPPQSRATRPLALFPQGVEFLPDPLVSSIIKSKPCRPMVIDATNYLQPLDTPTDVLIRKTTPTNN